MNATGHIAAMRIRVGEFLLDSSERLWKDGAAVDLVPQVCALLRALLDRPGEVLTKDDLLAKVWPGIEVSDSALSQAVKRLRVALGDDARTPRYIQTVHRRGFRLIAPIAFEMADPAPSSSAAVQTPLFVGREREQDLLASLLQAARRGRRQVVLVEGNTGIGKTALVRTFLTRALESGDRVASSQCIQQQVGMEPYLPVFEALDRSLRSNRALLDILRRYAPSWLAQMPWFLAPEERADLEKASSDAASARMPREMARTLEVISGEAPLLLVLEDLQWADPSTVDLLALVASRPDPARLMVLGTYRPVDAIAFDHPIAGVARNLAAAGVCTRVSLAALDPADVRSYLAERFATPAVADELAAALHERSEGNPLFLAAIVDHLVERGFIVQNRAWELTRPIDDEALREIPGNLREMIELQLESLDPGELEVLQAASVAAVEFRSASVAAALDRNDAAGLEDVERVCRGLIDRRHLLSDVGDEIWPDGTRTASYGFCHQLYRQSLYESIPAGQRRRFHQRIGERLERGFAADLRRVVAELAGHFSQSGDDTKAFTYLTASARQAHRRFAEREAVELLELALTHLERTPPSRDRDMAELQLRTGVVLAEWIGELERPAETEHHMIRIRALVESPGAGQRSFRLSSRLWTIYATRSLPGMADPLANHMLSMAGDDVGRRLEALTAKGMTSLMLGRFAAGLAHLSDAARLFDGGAAPSVGNSGQAAKWEELQLLIGGYCSTALFFSGALDRSIDRIRETNALSNGDFSAKHAAATALGSAGILCMLGSLTLGRSYSDRGVTLAEQSGLKSLIAAASPQRVWLDLTAGTEIDAAAAIREAWQDYLASRAATPTPVSPILLADACRLAGLADDGIEVVTTVWRDTRDGGVRWYDAELKRLEGELLLLRDGKSAQTRVRKLYGEALSLARAQGCSLYELRAACSLARLDGGSKKTRAALRTAYSAFSEGLDSVDLRAAADLLGRA